MSFILTFKFDVSQIFRKVMKCYLKPLIKLFGKFSYNLSQTVYMRENRKDLATQQHNRVKKYIVVVQ